MFLPNPGILAAGVGGGPKTYAEFQAHIRGMASQGNAEWFSPIGASAARYWTTTNTSLSGNMYGSSWLSNANFGAVTCRLAQHAFPNTSVFDQQTSSTFDLYFEVEDGGEVGSFSSYSRNGYTSLSAGGGPFLSVKITDLIYWDGTRAQRVRPNLGLGPEPYDW